MPAIYPVVTTRVSEALIHARLVSQFEFDNQELVRLQDQVSTGYRISTPSQDAPAAIRAIAIQRWLEQKQQAKTNLSTTESFISATDEALSGATNLLNHVRALALTAIGTTTTDEQRVALRNEIQDTINQFTEIGNRQFRGRYLFAGSRAMTLPFTRDGQYVVYHGNEISLQNYVDVDILSETNVNGSDAFGAITAEIEGSADLNPILTETTKLSQLRGGRGITRGSIRISDGTTTSTVDLAGAVTVGDVIQMIEANAPTGRDVNVTLSGNGLILDIDDAGGGNFTVREVPGGSTASELGILNTTGVGTALLLGSDLDPQLELATRLSDVLGTRASASIVSTGPNNDFVVEAVQNGAAFNNVLVQFVDGSATGDQAIATYDSGANTLTIDISPGVTRVNTIVDAINATGVFTARLDDKLDMNNDGSGMVDLAATATTSGGSGENLDLGSGIQVFNGGVAHTLDFSSAVTVEDLLNVLNGSEANVIAAINAAGTGINVRSRVSGADFMIGENGGNTARQLGVRSLTEETFLAELNYGRGVEDHNGADLVVVRRDGVSLDIDVSTAETVGDVIDLINNHANNVGNVVAARLAQFGNGIELEDANPAGSQDLTVVRNNGFAAWHLGLVPKGQDQSVAPAPGVGQPQVLTGADVNPVEAPGVFNTLLRLSAAVENFDLTEIERVAARLDENFSDMAFSRADLGGKARGLETIGARIDSEEIDLRSALSREIDADLVKSVSDLAARQANLEATLKLAAESFRLSLLNYL